MRARRSLLIALLLLAPSLAMAIRFPDVPANFAHKQAIEKLTDAGVISGNPDGTFHPNDPVNRAAILKMLYLAAKIEPERVGGCFPDVQPGSWYELYVCDAASRGFVQGYVAEGGMRSFRPAQPVTRAEAIKLALVVFGIPEADLNAGVTMYGDISAADWHARYVHTALATGVLPIPGQDGETFHPAQLLERGEAAAYIWNAMGARGSTKISLSSSSSASSVTGSASSGLSEIERRAAAALRTIEQERKALERAQANTRAVAVPFTGKETFDGREPFSYEFSVGSAPIVVDVLASITDWTSGSLSCTLYHLGRSGFSQEYYMGFKDGKNCLIRAALSPGNWRLQLVPDILAPTFTVSVKLGKGDGNDGFSQAATLLLGKVRSDSLDTGDLEDWYTFSVPSDPKTVAAGGKELVLSISSTDPLGCSIYPLDDVDQYGFTGPECGFKYLFPTGTYMVSVRHGTPLSVRESYSIQVK